MKKYFLTITLLFSVLLQAQEENPNVELPDFVILGREDISVRHVDKIDPDFIPTVSKDFLKPEYKPDQLSFVDISNPVGNNISLLDTSSFRKGFLELKAGRYQLPSGEINYAFPFNQGMLHGVVKGLNQVEYKDNSDLQTLEGKLEFNYSLPTDIQVLPGTKFSLNGEHSRDKYKFFGSIDPDRKRTLNAGNASVGIQNLYMKEFIFDLRTGGDFTYLDNEKFDEALYYLNGFARVKLNNFGIGVHTIYNYQNLSTDFYNDFNTNFFFIRPTVLLELFDKVMIEAGLTFSSGGGEHLNTLYASAGFEIAKNLVLLGEYSPQGENMTAGKFQRENFYFTQQNLSRIFVKKQNRLRVTLKYEFETYYQLDGGFEYYNSDNLPYFYNVNEEGFFEVNTADATSTNLFLNMLYHLGPYGYLYAGFNYQNVEDNNSKRVPYIPHFNADLSYGYPFSSEWKGEVKLKYLSDRFADIENQVKLSAIWNLDLKILYEFDNNAGVFFEINNILNSKKDTWEGYQEKPVDLMLGLHYFFN